MPSLPRKNGTEEGSSLVAGGESWSPSLCALLSHSLIGGPTKSLESEEPNSSKANKNNKHMMQCVSNKRGEGITQGFENPLSWFQGGMIDVLHTSVCSANFLYLRPPFWGRTSSQKASSCRSTKSFFVLCPFHFMHPSERNSRQKDQKEKWWWGEKKLFRCILLQPANENVICQIVNQLMTLV